MTSLSLIVAVQSGEPTNLEPLDKTLLYWTVDIAVSLGYVAANLSPI
jgi:hypothetical protein